MHLRLAAYFFASPGGASLLLSLTRQDGGMDSPEVPSIMMWLVETLQAEPVDFSLNAFRCCGPIFMTQEEESADLSYLIQRK
jgi:heterodisulfide reductase subunit B